MATCPSCGHRARLARVVTVSPRRPYRCPTCGARSGFERRREHLRGVVAVVCGALVASALAHAWPVPARLALTFVLLLGAVALSRLGLPLRPVGSRDTSEPYAPL